MGFLDKLARALTEVANEKRASGKFKFQEVGKPPMRDSKGRVVVKLHPGPNITLNVDSRDATIPAQKYLLGKVEAYKEVEGRGVRVRLIPPQAAAALNSIAVETPKGELIGWVAQKDSKLAAKAIESLLQQLQTLVQDLGSFVFEVSAIVDGTYDVDEDESGKEFVEPDISYLEIRIKDPAELDIFPEK